MTYTIRNINNNSSFQNENEETILHAALRSGHLFPYACQSGRCGSCKGRVVKGATKNLTPEIETLTDTEREAGWCLMCQTIPEEDLEIDIEEIAQVREIEVKTLPTRVREKNLLCDDVIQLYLSLPNTQKFDFLPGQYIKILLKNGKQRSFSIANTAAQAAEEGLELHIRIVPGGHFSPQVKEQVQIKDILRIQGPFGTYFLRQDEQRPVLLVAGGTGFAPIKGMIEEAIVNGLEQNITLYWGVRSEEDLYLNELAQQWADTLPGFRYIPVLSDTATDNHWEGRQGMVHSAIAEDIEDASALSVYTSGPPVMINALGEVLKERGLPEGYFYTDAFEYAAVEEMA